VVGSAWKSWRRSIISGGGYISGTRSDTSTHHFIATDNPTMQLIVENIYSGVYQMVKDSRFMIRVCSCSEKPLAMSRSGRGFTKRDKKAWH